MYLYIVFGLSVLLNWANLFRGFAVEYLHNKISSAKFPVKFSIARLLHIIKTISWLFYKYLSNIKHFTGILT